MNNKISCKAHYCKYHCENDECKADKVSVGCPSASSSQETCCDTFVPKN